MPRLVSSPDEIDADWLGEALAEAGVLPTGRVIEVSSRLIGTGKIGENVRYELRYQGAPDGAPRSVVAKLPASDPTPRASASLGGFYWREVQFYRELAPQIEMRTPHVYTALIHENRTDYVILMEDMAPAEPGDQIEGCGPAQAELAIREAARLHGPLHGSPRLAGLEWVTQTSVEGAELGRAMLMQMWPGFLERFGHVLSPEAEALGERFTRCHVDWALGYEGPRTLAHADYRLENMLFGTGEGVVPIAVVDWQSCMHTSGLADVAYFIGGGLTVENRRIHERELVEAYRLELAARGIELSADDCWHQYRRYALHGVLITVLGAMLSDVDERGERMFAAMIERHLQHGLDLESAEFL